MLYVNNVKYQVFSQNFQKISTLILKYFLVTIKQKTFAVNLHKKVYMMLCNRVGGVT